MYSIQCCKRTCTPPLTRLNNWYRRDRSWIRFSSRRWFKPANVSISIEMKTRVTQRKQSLLLERGFFKTSIFYQGGVFFVFIFKYLQWNTIPGWTLKNLIIVHCFIALRLHGLYLTTLSQHLWLLLLYYSLKIWKVYAVLIRRKSSLARQLRVSTPAVKCILQTLEGKQLQ